MLLVECNVLEKVEVINEGKEGNTRLRLRGKFQQCDEQNNNGRIYPRKILEAQVQAIQEKIGDRSLVGALDHPANDAIHLSQASHLITGLSVGKDGSVIGECEILSTPNGKIVEALINDGVKIGISSRGVGSVTEGIKGKIVNEDFKLITFDLVSDPSTRGAFPELSESMRENSERAQAIVSKHKKDRVLLTMLESKISEALKGKQKKLDKNKNNKIDAEDFEMLRGEKKSMGEKTFPDLSGDGKVTKKDILIGRGVIKGKKKGKKVEEGEDNDPLYLKLLAGQRPAGTKKPKPKPKKVYEGEVKQKNKARMRSALAKLGAGALAKEKTFTPAERAGSYETYRKSGGKEQTGNVVGKGRAKLRKKFGSANEAVIEGLKKICWGNHYNEATRLRKMSKGTPEEQKRARQEGAETARRVGSHRKISRALKKGKEVTDSRFAKQVVEGKIKNDPEAFKRAKKSYVQRDQERQARLQQVIADNERRRIAAGGAGRDQSKPKKK